LKKIFLTRTAAVLTWLLVMISISYFASAAEVQELKSELLQLNAVKEEMQAAGIGVARVSDLITEGFYYLNNQDYNKTNETINQVYELKRIAFNAQSELAFVNALYLGISQYNISLSGASGKNVEWDINYSQREFEKENYEEALKTLDNTKRILINSVNAKYNYLNDSLSILEEKTGTLQLSQYRVRTLQGLLAETLAAARIDELEMIRAEIEELNKSIGYYEELKTSIQLIESKGLSAQVIKDGLAESESYINLADYKTAISKLESLKKLAEQAISLEKEAAEFETSLSDGKAEYSNDFSEAEALLEKAKYELKAGNYAEAGRKLSQAQQSFESAKAKLLVEGASRKAPFFSLKEFLAKNWLYLTAGLIILLIIISLTHKVVSQGIRKKRLASLEKELRVNEKMVQELQRSYFVRHKMSRENYDQAYDSLQEKIIRLKERTSLLNKKIKKQENKPGG